MPLRSLLLTCLCLCAAPATAADPEAYEDPESAAAVPDFHIQGEYSGTLDGQKWGVQIIALGEGKFDAVAYRGGLPGDGWDGDRGALVNGSGTLQDGRANIQAGGYSAEAAEGRVRVRQDGRELGSLSRLVRQSPTMGKPAPEGARILFDGSDTREWSGARLSPDGLLIPPATSRETFGDFHLHVEFRTPFQPKARGQGRGNSGVYCQGRHEVQVLDSFGLKGEHNECGGIYSVAAPSINMCLPPLQWQTYDIDYKAARYDAEGKRTAPARLTVLHNGVKVHDDVEVGPATTAAPLKEGPQPGPIHLQDHGNPVRYRHVWILPK